MTIMEIDLSKYYFITHSKISKKITGTVNEKLVKEISAEKKEPEWMLEFRLKALRHFLDLPMPTFGPSLDEIDFNKLTYYIKPSERKAKKWEDVPEEIKRTFDRLGVPEAERKFLAGLEAQFESESVYEGIKKELEEKGIIFMDMDSAVKEYPELVKKYFSTVIPSYDNKFAALNSALWSGGSFLYVPKGVKFKVPVQAYFRMNSPNFGQFERTLIICEEDSEIHYNEGCTAPLQSTYSLHAGVVEAIIKKGAKLRYTTIQNWSTDIYNLVTKRAFAYEKSRVEWIDANIGSKVTMKYPAVYLKGRGASAHILSLSYAGKGQHQDSGAKAIHLAPNTTSIIRSKSISLSTGISVFRSTVKGNEKGIKSMVKCDSLVMGDSNSISLPYFDVEKEAEVVHETFAGSIGEKELFYLMSRGLDEEEALYAVVSGFIQDFVKELPFEYAVEFNRLIKMEIEDYKN